MAITSAPFTEEQVKLLVDWQSDAERHPYTCICDSGQLLVPGKTGLWCTACGRLQTWAHLPGQEPVAQGAGS